MQTSRTSLNVYDAFDARVDELLALPPSAALPAVEASGDGGGDGGGGGSADPGSVGDGGGDDDGEPVGDLDPASIAEEYDREALSGLEDGEDEPGSGGRGKGSGKGGDPHADDDPVNEFINKHYQGDRAAFIHSLGESQREAKRLAAKLDELEKAGKAGKSDEPVDVTKLLDDAKKSDQEFSSLNQDIESCKVEHSNLTKRQTEITVEAKTTETKITQLETELPYIEDAKQHTQKMAELQRLRSSLSTLTSEYLTNDARIRAVISEHKQAVRAAQRRERELKTELERESNETKNHHTYAQRQNKLFDMAALAHLKQYAVDPKSEQFEYIKDALRAQLAAKIEQMESDDPLEPEDLFEELGKLLARYAKVHNLKPRRAGAPAAAPAKRLGSVPPGGPRPAPRNVIPSSGRRPSTPVDDGGGDDPKNGDGGSRRPRNQEELFNDPNYWRKRADHVSEELTRRHAARKQPRS